MSLLDVSIISWGYLRPTSQWSLWRIFSGSLRKNEQIIITPERLGCCDLTLVCRDQGKLTKGTSQSAACFAPLGRDEMKRAIRRDSSRDIQIRPPIHLVTLTSGWGIYLQNISILKWWYPQNTPKWSFFVGKPMLLGTTTWQPLGPLLKVKLLVG